jgi:membrane protease YdiL (CAAX protease family)
MLSAKPWKPESIARLLLSGILCIFMASIVVVGAHYTATVRPVRPAFFLAAVGALGCWGVALWQAQRSWDLELLMGRMTVLMGCMFGGMVCGIVAQKIAGSPPTSTAAGQTIMVEGAALFLFARFVREHGLGWREAFGWGRGWPMAVGAGIAAGLMFLPVAWALQRGSAELMTHFHIEPREQQAIEVLRHSAAWWNQAGLGLVAIVFAPLVEETFFRGILYPAIKQFGFPRLAVWGTAVLFALVHFNLPTFLPLLVLALMLTYLYEYTGNLLASIAAHCTFNTLNFALLYWMERRWTG